MLMDHQDEISGDVFELLYGLGDFTEFKDTMISHKRSLAPHSGNDLQGLFSKRRIDDIVS